MRGGTTHGAEAAGRIGDVGFARHAHYPAAQLLQQFLNRREVLDGFDGSGAHHDIGTMFQNGQRQRGYVVGVVLVVGIGIDDDIRPPAQAGIKTCHEAACQTLIAGMPDDMIDTIRPRHRHRVVRAAVVDDQPFDGIKSRHFARQGRKGNGQCVGLVVARDLDDELQL